MSPHLSIWQTTSSVPPLDPGQLDLWRFRLDYLDTAAARKLLSSDELERAGRLRVAEKRHQFISARLALRSLLGDYLDQDPSSLSFTYGEHGKPALLSTPQLFFNLSHSGSWGLLAVTNAGPVGVDIEQFDKQLEFSSVAKRYFTQREISRLHAAAEKRQLRLFYRIWTQKEALIKLQGRSFAAGTKSSATDGENHFRLLPIARNCLAAIAFPSSILSICRYQKP